MTAQTKGSGMTWVGRAIRRVEDPALVTGQGRFTADLPAVHWVRFLRSPAAAGKIESITTPDGAMVITAADLRDVKPILPMLHKFDYRPLGQPILAEGEVRFVGEPVAAVVAASEEEAEDIADEIGLVIGDATPLVDARDAVAPGARQIHAGVPGNVILEGRIQTPDFDKVWASAAKIVTVEARSRRQNATPMEPRAAHAAYDLSTGRVTLTCTTQMPHLTRTAIADVLGMPESDLRVIAPDVGGGFGQKMSLASEYVLLVWLARKHRSSFAWTEDRRENLIASFHSRDQYISLHGAFDTQGKLLALKGDVVSNVGAYSCFPTTCGVEPLMAMAELPGPYDFRAYDCRARGVVTNTCTMAPYRGVSRPTITFTLERLMDKAARAFGVEPTEIRRRNLIAKFPYTSAAGLKFDEASYLETLAMAAAAIDLPAFRKRQSAARARGRYLGIGFATFSERTGYGSPAFAARGMAITPGWETVIHAGLAVRRPSHPHRLYHPRPAAGDDRGNLDRLRGGRRGAIVLAGSLTVSGFRRRQAALDKLNEAVTGSDRDRVGEIAPGPVEQALRYVVLLPDRADLPAIGPADMPDKRDMLLAARCRGQLDLEVDV